MQDFERAAEALRGADALLVGAGAGMGVDSGLPDFRGDQGFWKAYPAYEKLGLRFIELADPSWFEKDPSLAWGFYGHRRNLYRKTSPHGGFALLRKWGERMAKGAFVFTSNVDGQFQRAGFAADRICEIHGSLMHLQCSRRCGAIWEADAGEINVDDETFRAREPLPRCPTCGALARPNVLMFGDSGWIGDRTDEQVARFDAWASGADKLVAVECGAGTAIPTVRRMCESAGRLIRINVREPEVRAPGHIGIAGKALATLEAIDRLL
jgi:NAD-dependent SIR2 family protein deacetylase